MSEQTSVALEVAKQTVEAYNTFKKAADTISTIVTANPISMILRAIFLLAMLIGMAALKKFIENLKREQAKILTEQQRAALAEYIRTLEAQSADDVFDTQNDL